MQEIVDKYDTSGTPFLLPIIRDMEADNRKQYKCESYRVNQSLKKIGKQLGLTISLTSYVARHSWASIAKSKNIPVATISEAMGHDSEHTTRIYLASLDTTVVDKANSLILNHCNIQAANDICYKAINRYFIQVRFMAYNMS